MGVIVVGVITGCYDKDKEQTIAAAVAAGQSIAKTQIPPFRAALGQAVRVAPTMAAAPCGSLPRDVDWPEQARLCGVDFNCVGITFVPYENQRTGQPLEETTVPSRAARVLNYRPPNRGMQFFYSMPDYARLVPEAESWSKPSFWSYELVVVDDGGAVAAGGGRAFVYEDTTKMIRCAGLWKADVAGTDDGDHRRRSIVAAVASLRGLP
jgi:hypothetical protein